MTGLNYIVLDVQGVGYRVSVPLSLIDQLPAAGGEAQLFIHTQVREDAIQLFGFLSAEDQDLFELLIGVNGVGPKVGLGVMSVLSSQQLAEAITAGDAAMLQRVPGIGGKTAQRIVLELKDRLSDQMWEKRGIAAVAPGESRSDVLGDAVEALMGLGYPRAQARTAAEKASKAGSHTDPASLVRAALQVLTTR